MTSSKRKADELDADNVIGIGYEAKLCGEGVDPNDPLYGTCYYGIAVRGGFTSPEALYAKRKREHESAARCDPKEIGFRAIIVRYGNRALSWRIVVSKTGASRVSTQEWANTWEKSVIAAAGGVLRDMEPDDHLQQTFNLTCGGNGDALSWWEGIQARCNNKWKKLQHELEEYVALNNTAAVPRSFVGKDGYKLGIQISCLRTGQMLKGRTDECARRTYLESLPGWSWDVRDTSWERLRRSIQDYVNETGTSRVPQKYCDTDGFPLGRKLMDVRRGRMLERKDSETRRAFLEALPGWTWNAREVLWDDFKYDILMYIKKTGTARVPFTYVDENGSRLGQTVMNVRKRGTYLRNKNDMVARRAWLETLPGWKW